MTQDDWSRYRPALAAGYEVGELVAASSDRAVFRGDSGGSRPEAFVWLIEVDGASPEIRRNRFLEAAFFDHPNLLRVYAAEALDSSGPPLLQVVTEPFEYALSNAGLPRPLVLEALEPVLLQVMNGLSWLHSQNLVYCVLSADSVVRAGGDWKLADFSELRLAGRSAPEDTRRLLTRRDLYAPPEAYEGVVSPAWDAWSLGMLIESLYAREARACGRNPALLPPGVAELLRGLRDADPAQRLGIEAFAELLAQSVPEFAPAAPAKNLPPASVPAIRKGRANARPEPLRRRSRFFAGGAAASGAGAILAVLYGHPVAVKSGGNANPVVTRLPAPGTGAGSQAAGNTASAPQRSKTPAAQPSSGSRTLAAVSSGAEVSGEPALSIEEEKRQISDLLHRWVNSTRRRDAAAQAALYAPLVQFYGKPDFSAEDVRRARARAFAEIGGARELSIEDLRFERVDPDRAVVSFLKTWDSPAGRFTGSTREEMVLRRIGGAWKISSDNERNRSERAAR